MLVPVRILSMAAIATPKAFPSTFLVHLCILDLCDEGVVLSVQRLGTSDDFTIDSKYFQFFDFEQTAGFLDTRKFKDNRILKVVEIQCMDGAVVSGVIHVEFEYVLSA